MFIQIIFCILFETVENVSLSGFGVLSFCRANRWMSFWRGMWDAVFFRDEIHRKITCGEKVTRQFLYAELWLINVF
jgi:hypothetical protein